MKSHKETRYEKLKQSGAHVVEGEELARLQQVLLEMVMDLQTVCEENGLECFVVGGSALGAVRHHGFIPWDDDVDLSMPREDLEKLKKIFREKLGDKYILNAPNYEEDATNRFPKILKKGTRFVEAGVPEDDRTCIKIDIFPLENVPDNPVARWVKGMHCTFLMFAGGALLSYEEARSRKEKMDARAFAGMLLSFRSSGRWFDRFDKVCRCRNSHSRDVGIPSGRKHYFGEILPRNVVFPLSAVAFEGHEMKIFADPDYALRNLYGNYMEIPPEEKREKHYVDKIEF